MDDEPLIALARDCMGRSYSPYSGYRVGAALPCRDGPVVTACNVGNVSYGLTLCAERVAVVRAVSKGRRDFVQEPFLAPRSAHIKNDDEVP